MEWNAFGNQWNGNFPFLFLEKKKRREENRQSVAIKYSSISERLCYYSVFMAESVQYLSIYILSGSFLCIFLFLFLFQINFGFPFDTPGNCDGDVADEKTDEK